MNVGALPETENDHLCGFVTDRDIVVRLPVKDSIRKPTIEK